MKHIIIKKKKINYLPFLREISLTDFFSKENIMKTINNHFLSLSLFLLFFCLRKLWIQWNLFVFPSSDRAKPSSRSLPIDARRLSQSSLIISSLSNDSASSSSFRPRNWDRQPPVRSQPRPPLPGSAYSSPTAAATDTRITL